MLSDGALKISFKAKMREPLSVSAIATPDGGSELALTSVATVSEPDKKDTLSLPLTAEGAAALEECGSLAVEVSAFGPGKSASAFAVFAEDDPECAKPVREFELETSAATPFGITAGPDGNIWFAEPGAGAVGRLSQNGVLDEIRIPVPPTAFPGDLAGHATIDVASGPDGAIWALAARGESVRRIDPATGEVTTYPLPTQAQGSHIAVGPDGNLWIGGLGASSLTRITPAGDVTDFPVTDSSPEPVSLTPYGIAAGGDGVVWFTASPPFGGGAAAIGRFDPATGETQAFHLSDPSKRLGDMAADPAGRLWFTTPVGNTIGRIDPGSGEIVEFEIPTVDSKPVGIAAAPDGSVWFTEASADNIGRYDPGSGVFTEYPLETLGSVPFGIAVGDDGNVYFSELGVGRIGRLDPNKAPIADPNTSDGKAMPPYETRCPKSSFLCMEQVTTGGTFKIGDALTQELPPGAITLTSGIPFPPRGPLPPPASGPIFESEPLQAEVRGTPLVIQVALAGSPAMMTFFTLQLPLDLHASQPSNPAGGCVIGRLDLVFETVNDNEGDGGNPLYTAPILGNNELAFWTGTLQANAFEVPQAGGCGVSAYLLDLLLGLPSPAGETRWCCRSRASSYPISRAPFAQKQPVRFALPPLCAKK